jgi:glycosyltransferase involved in cell wall biosynthesis
MSASPGHGADKPLLSVAICTHNRAEELTTLVNQFAPALAALSVELIVVDSASDPANARGVRAAVLAHPNARLIRLDTPGVSLARNAALESADSQWLGFVDDDELPAANWTEAALALIGRLPGDCAACGGNVLPVWPANFKLPKMGQRWKAYLSLIDQRGELDQSRNPSFGIGHSISRVSALRGVGGFNASLGRDGASLLSGEEVLLIDQLISSGWSIWHSDTLSVSHLIPVERLQVKWALDRAYWEGVSQSRIMKLTGDRRLKAMAWKIRCKAIVLRALNRVAPRLAECDLRIAYSGGFLNDCAGAPLQRAS